ncbi:MAG: preprotein translocase subunit TatA [Actinoallomurus sp.]|nr:preprotein translocase subunit TatA [Actinoallomurus sp.]
MGEMAPWHWLIIAVLFIVLFGSSKLPGAARSVGRSLRILKSEVSGLHTDDEPQERSAASPAVLPEVRAPAGPAPQPQAEPAVAEPAMAERSAAERPS